VRTQQRARSLGLAQVGASFAQQSAQLGEVRHLAVVALAARLCHSASVAAVAGPTTPETTMPVMAVQSATAH
jgi:hypothetical protein